MRRRDFIIFLVGAMGGWPSAVRAQQKAIPVIGFLSGASPGPYKSYVAAFHQRAGGTANEYRDPPPHPAGAGSRPTWLVRIFCALCFISIPPKSVPPRLQ
jgi:hypothetical protein